MRTRENIAVPGTPHFHCLRVSWVSLVSAHDEGRYPGPPSPQGCWHDSSPSCLPAWGRLHGQLVSWARPSREREGWHAVLATAPLSSPSPPGVSLKSGLVSGKVTCEQEEGKMPIPPNRGPLILDQQKDPFRHPHCTNEAGPRARWYQASGSSAPLWLLHLKGNSQKPHECPLLPQDFFLPAREAPGTSS